MDSYEFFVGRVIMSDLFLGTDLGGTNVVVGLLDNNGNILARQSHPTDVEKGPQALVDRVAAASGQLIEQCRVPLDDVKAIGIGSPGPLSVEQGKLIKLGNLPGFDGFPIRARLSDALGIPAVLDNDANAACWGEFWLGAGKNIMPPATSHGQE